MLTRFINQNMHGIQENEKINRPMFLTADVIVGFEQNYTVSESVGSFQVCFRVFNPPDNQELILSLDLVVDTIEGSAGIVLLVLLNVYVCACA